MGPIQERVAGGEALSSPLVVEPREALEPEVLPPVVIDEILTEAFGPALPSSDEPTYRVGRPKELGDEEPIRHEPDRPLSRSVWRLIIPVALVGGALLAALGLLGLKVFLSQ